MTPEEIAKAREIIANAERGSLRAVAIEALDEVERLQAEEYTEALLIARLNNEKLRTEYERLEDERAAIRRCSHDQIAELCKLRAENERYIQAIEDIPIITFKEQQELVKLRAENAKLLRVKEGAEAYLKATSRQPVEYAAARVLPELGAALKALDEDGK